MTTKRYADNEESRDALANLAWARSILRNPAYAMPNGRNSHEVANEVAEQAHDTLIDHARYTA
jgi:hypothetical protein